MKNSKLYSSLGLIICLLSSAFFIFPLAIMVTRSFSVGGIENYSKVFDKYNLLLNFTTSVIVVGCTLAITAVVVSFAAYAFSKLHFRGSRALYYILLFRHDGSCRRYDISTVSGGSRARDDQFSVFPGFSLCYGKLLFQSFDFEKLLRFDSQRDVGGRKHRRRRINCAHAGRLSMPVASPVLLLCLCKPSCPRGTSCKWRVSSSPIRTRSRSP